MSAHVNNGTRGHLVVEGLHDGLCGVQNPTPGEFARHQCHKVVAFRANAATRKAAMGDTAVLDGQAFEIVGIEQSRISAGFERLYLTAKAA